MKSDSLIRITPALGQDEFQAFDSAAQRNSYYVDSVQYGLGLVLRFKNATS